MKKYSLKIIFVLSTIIFLNSKTQGQELPLKNAVSVIKSIATDLNVSESRAKQIWSILNYNQPAIKQVAKNREMGAEKRHMMIKKLLEERTLHIDTSLNATEKQLLMQHQAPSQMQRQMMLEKINRSSLENNTEALRGGSLKQVGERRISNNSSQNSQ